MLLPVNMPYNSLVNENFFKKWDSTLPPSLKAGGYPWRLSTSRDDCLEVQGRQLCLVTTMPAVLHWGKFHCFAFSVSPSFPHSGKLRHRKSCKWKPQLSRWRSRKRGLRKQWRDQKRVQGVIPYCCARCSGLISKVHMHSSDPRQPLDWSCRSSNHQGPTLAILVTWMTDPNHNRKLRLELRSSEAD